MRFENKQWHRVRKEFYNGHDTYDLSDATFLHSGVD